MHTIFIQLNTWKLQRGPMMLNKVHPQNIMPHLFSMEKLNSVAHDIFRN